MWVSGQRHAPVALYPPGKGPQVPTVQEAGWVPEEILTEDREKNPLPLPGIKPRSSSLQSDTILTALPGSPL
jgi:hypothetical protein